MKKLVVPTPITDLVERLLSTDTPLKTVLDAARATERALIEAARSSAVDAETLNRRRQADRERKSAERLKPPKSSAEGSPQLFLSSEIESQTKDSHKRNSSPVVASAEKPKGPHRLPEDWQPKTKHFDLWRELAAKHHFQPNDDDVVGFATEMREWATANAHRGITRKTDWDATFSGWLRRAAPQRRGRGGSANQSNRPTMADIARGDFT